VIPLWVNKYIGIPFKGDGRDERGCNCWGLVRMVLQRECGIALPAYDTITADELRRIAMQMKQQSESWVQVLAGQTFDVMLMGGRIEAGEPQFRQQSTRAPVHCGVMVSETHILHVNEKTAAVAVPLTDRSVRFRLYGLYRHTSLA
jgi:cell wall-associated NlpC family hydrolase